MLKLTVFVLCILSTSLIGCHGNSPEEVVYSNSWAVEVKGGHHVANELARKHGFVNKGQVCRTIAGNLCCVRWNLCTFFTEKINAC